MLVWLDDEIKWVLVEEDRTVVLLALDVEEA